MVSRNGKIVIGLGLLGALGVGLFFATRSKAQCPPPFKPALGPCVEGAGIVEGCSNSPNISTFKCQDSTWVPLNNQCAQPSANLNFVNVIPVGGFEVKIEYLDQKTFTVRQFRSKNEEFITGLNCLLSRKDINREQRDGALGQFGMLR